MVAIIFGVVCISGLLLFGRMTYLAHHDYIRHHHIPVSLRKNDETIRVFFISDIHRRIIQGSSISAIEERIDLVVIGGDLAERNVPLSRIKENIRLLHKLEAPIYFVWGNNDYELNYRKLEELLEAESVTCLKNESEMVELPTGQPLYLIGFDDPDNSSPIVELLEKPDEDMPVLLLSHRPSVFEEMGESIAGMIDLVLSGHTHGGQIRIFGIGPYTRGGIKTIHDTPVLISEGYGYTSLPFRLGTTAECHIVTLKGC
ncbi:metallophosphoesterase [Sediminibacillus halophilus]|uniref:Predicted phosphohydrolase, MPP superfamily n=1 Tax=Sediminibacillus halophilus TaxID=482461 RepID=A0A1G9LU20_9BACI|nr:metallophosphoesterase [Sediminibacillus halophilus]SDL65602.1 Predicted phosphohydrolase, MPP superfamily [Sediminibacillus halophilus]